MSFKTVLEAIGHDVKSVFDWIGSAKGEAVIATGEAVALAINPAAGGLIAVANSTLTEIVKVEALAAGAGAQNGTGVQKLTAVVAAATPEILSYAEKNKFPVPTADKIQAAVNALVAFANALEAPKS